MREVDRCRGGYSGLRLKHEGGEVPLDQRYHTEPDAVYARRGRKGVAGKQVVCGHGPPFEGQDGLIRPDLHLHLASLNLCVCVVRVCVCVFVRHHIDSNSFRQGADAVVEAIVATPDDIPLQLGYEALVEL